MIEFIQRIWLSLIAFLQKFQDFLNPFLQRLDPALFQNIILGVLAIFIPFAIVFLTDILNSKKEKRSEFEKMVLNDEVLGTKKVFWLSIIGIVFFAFFSGVDTSSPTKIVSIIAAIILIFFFWEPFKKILRFSEGYKPEFEILFLKKLSFSKFFNFKNKNKAEKIFRSWNSFWSEKSDRNESDFTNIFISHIDDAIKLGKFDLAVQLAQVYINNIEKRDRFSIGYEILPKVFKWNEILWEKQQNSESDSFWNWDYFGREFFQAIIKILLKDGRGPYQLFSSFEEHVKKSEEKLEEITDKKEKEKYIPMLFSHFCPIFFNEIDSAPLKYEIWEDNFPVEWKIAIANKDNRVSRIILHEFLRWSGDRIFKKEGKEEVDRDLTEVINGIFPNVHPSLFSAFLMLFFSSKLSNEVKYAIEEDPNFYISEAIVSWSGSVEESKEERDTKLFEKMKAKDFSQKEETIQIIVNFFWQYWNELKIIVDENNRLEWESADKEKKELMLKVKRKENLEKIKAAIESEEIKRICESSERKESYRKDFLELIELLISEIEK